MQLFRCIGIYLLAQVHKIFYAYANKQLNHKIIATIQKNLKTVFSSRAPKSPFP